MAIIGVLVAISIPIFTSQLEKAREATDLANIRSAYAECSAALLTGGGDEIQMTTDKKTAYKQIKLNQTVKDWQTDKATEVAGKTLTAIDFTPTGSGSETVYVSVNESTGIAVGTKAPSVSTTPTTPSGE